MNVNHTIINIAHSLGTKGYTLEGLYRRMQNKPLFMQAYGNIASNRGITTQGVSASDTVQAMSEARVDKILSQFADKSYRWKPARRVYIPKVNGGTRPLGVPSFSDKLVQEVMRLILEAYYEPQFRDSSHGFRPKRSCHTALQTIEKTWKGVTWFIEGDIKGCFDNVDHAVLLNVMGRNIKDQQFLSLVQRMLKAGYMDDWKYHHSYSGTPQGGIISPLLTNILLNEFDTWVEDELIPRHTKGQKRRHNPEWWKHRRMYRYNKQRCRQTGLQIYETRAQERLKRMRVIPTTNPNDPDFRRLRYVRYADDFLLGFTGTKAEAKTIRQEISAKLAELGLTLSLEKTHITHAHSEKANFLGFELSVTHNNTRMRQRKFNGRSYRYRTGHGHIRLHVPRSVVQSYIRRYSKNGKPHQKYSLVNASDFEIIRSFGDVYRGLANYYAPAHNVSYTIGKIQHVMLESCIRTLATKHKCKRALMYRKYYQVTSTGNKGLVCTYKHPHTQKIHRAEFGGVPFKAGQWPKYVTDRNDQYVQVYRGTQLLKRLDANTCELCGKQTSCVVHHIRALRDLNEKRKRGQPLTRIEVYASARRRKQVVVCPTCHKQIHAGTYNGKAVK